MNEKKKELPKMGRSQWQTETWTLIVDYWEIKKIFMVSLVVSFKPNRTFPFRDSEPTEQVMKSFSFEPIDNNANRFMKNAQHITIAKCSGFTNNYTLVFIAF